MTCMQRCFVCRWDEKGGECVCGGGRALKCHPRPLSICAHARQRGYTCMCSKLGKEMEEAIEICCAKKKMRRGVHRLMLSFFKQTLDSL